MTKWPRPIDHTYILCDHRREPDRAAYLTGWLSHNQLDADCYTMSLACYGPELSASECHRVYDPWQNRKPIEYQRSGTSYNLKPGEISLVLNWAAAAQAAVAAGHNVVMMLESDVLFDDGFLMKLTAVMNPLEGKDWDFLSLSAGAGLRPPRNPQSHDGWFSAPYYYHTRTTDAMIFKVDMLKKILGTLFPFVDVLDWELNYQLTLHKSISLWLDPPILRQGSGKEYATTL
jgi:hypothetical protein